MGNAFCTSSSLLDVELPQKDSSPSLTADQKNAIKDTWRLLIEDEWAHGARIFFALFKKHPEYRQNFPFLDANGVLELSELATREGLRRHSNQFLDTLDTLVSHAVMPITKGWRKAVKGMAYLYKDVESNAQVFKALTEVFVDYLQSNFPEQVLDYERKSWEAFFEELVPQVCPKLQVEAKELPRSKSATKIEWPSHYNIDEKDSIFEPSIGKEGLSSSWTSLVTPMSEQAKNRLLSLVSKKDRRYLEEELQRGFERRHSTSLRSYDIDKLNIPMPKGFTRNKRTSTTSSFHQSTASSRAGSVLTNRRVTKPQMPIIISRTGTDDASTSDAKSAARSILDPWPSLTRYKSQESLTPRYSRTPSSVNSQKSFETKTLYPKSASEYRNPISERTSEFNTLFPRYPDESKLSSPPRRTVVPKNFFRDATIGTRIPSFRKTHETKSPLQLKTEKRSTQSTALEKNKSLLSAETSSVRFNERPVKHQYDVDEEIVEEEYDESPRVRRRRRMSVAEDVLHKEKPWMV